MVYLIFALILLGIYLLTYRNIGKTVGNALSEDSTIFNRDSSRFYQLLTFSPLVALYEPLMRMGNIIVGIDNREIDWTPDISIVFCVVVGLWVWYYVATRKLTGSLFWASADIEENLYSLQIQVKRYFVVNAVVSVVQLLWLIGASSNDTYYLYPYTWLIVILLIVVNAYLIKAYPTQKILLGIEADNTEPVSEPQSAQKTENSETVIADKKSTKRCPYCGEEILAVAKKCKHCGEWLNNK